MGKAVVDTNVLLDSPEILDELEGIILCSSVLEEIDGLKKSENSAVAHKAREANRRIERNKKKIKFVLKDIYTGIPENWDINKRDNKIVLTALENKAKLISNDINVRIKAEALGVFSHGWYKNNEDEVYKGYRELSGDTAFINDLFCDIQEGNTKYNFVTNEYLILTNTDLNNVSEYRFDGKHFLDLKLPPSKVIKGLNSHQRCALDLLNNKDIGIKALLGNYGSGKTYLAMMMALYQVQDKGNYGKILAIREPVGEGVEIGFLKGTFEDKTECFFRPLAQCLKGGEMELQNLINFGVLENNIPRNLKGTTFHDTWMIVDEAEDLSEKQIKMIGTRLGKNSVISFCGDYNQAIKNANSSNPLVRMCKELKGDVDFGCMVLPEDVRSELSKKFADLFLKK